MPVICEPTRLKMKSSSRKKFKWYANICLNFFVCFSTSNMRFVSLGLLCACVCVCLGGRVERMQWELSFLFLFHLKYHWYIPSLVVFGFCLESYFFFQCLLCVNITDIQICGWIENIWLHFSHQIFNWISLQSSANRMEWHLNIDSRTKCRIMNV